MSYDELALIDAVAQRARRDRPDWMCLVLLDAAPMPNEFLRAPVGDFLLGKVCDPVADYDNAT